MAQTQQLSRAAAAGFAWQGLSYLVGKLLVLGATITLAHALTPADYGLVTLALVFLNFVEVITDFGVTQALVYLPVLNRRNDAALACSIVFGGVLAAAVFLSAPLVAQQLGNPQSAPLLRVLSLSLLVGSTALVPDSLLRRDLQFRRRLVGQVALAATRGGLAIVLALAGVGAWSLVYAQIAGQLAFSIAAWSRVVGYRPDLRFWRLRYADIRPLLSFGLPTAASGLVATLVINVDYFIVGAALGASALGFYTLGFRIPEMVIISAFQVVSAVTYPVYNRARGSAGRLGRGYLRVVRVQAAYGLVVGLGMAEVAPMLVHVVFGPHWERSIVPLQALALYAAFRSLGMGVVDLLKAVGRPRLALVLALMRLGVLVPALTFASRVSIDVVAWTQAALALLFVAIMQSVAARELAIPLPRLAAAFLPGLVAGAAAVLGAALGRALVPGDEVHRLLVATALGGAFAVAALLSVSPAIRRDMAAVLRPRTPAPAPQPE